MEASLEWRILLLAPFVQSCALARAVAQIIELRPSHTSLPLDLNLLDARGTQQKGPFDSHAVRGQPPYREVGVVPAFSKADDGPAEFLDSFPVAFLDPDVDADGIARLDRRDRGVQFGFDELHGFGHSNHLPGVSTQPAARGNRAARRARVYHQSQPCRGLEAGYAAQRPLGERRPYPGLASRSPARYRAARD